MVHSCNRIYLLNISLTMDRHLHCPSDSDQRTHQYSVWHPTLHREQTVERPEYLPSHCNSEDSTFLQIKLFYQHDRYMCHLPLPSHNFAVQPTGVTGNGGRMSPRPTCITYVALMVMSHQINYCINRIQYHRCIHLFDMIIVRVPSWC
jgi:hypothetical protein